MGPDTGVDGDQVWRKISKYNSYYDKNIESGNKNTKRLCRGFLKLLITTIMLIARKMMEGIFCMPKLSPSVVNVTV